MNKPVIHFWERKSYGGRKVEIFLVDHDGKDSEWRTAVLWANEKEWVLYQDGTGIGKTSDISWACFWIREAR